MKNVTYIALAIALLYAAFVLAMIGWKNLKTAV